MDEIRRFYNKHMDIIELIKAYIGVAFFFLIYSGVLW